MNLIRPEIVKTRTMRWSCNSISITCVQNVDSNKTVTLAINLPNNKPHTTVRQSIDFAWELSVGVERRIVPHLKKKI